MFHWDHQMRVAKVLGHDDPAHVILVQPLLNDDNGALLWVIEARRHDFGEPHIGGEADLIRLRFHGVVGVVDDEPITALTTPTPLTEVASFHPVLLLANLILVNCSLEIAKRLPQSF